MHEFRSVPNARIALLVAAGLWTGLVLGPFYEDVTARIASGFTVHALALYGLSLLALAAFPRSRRADLWLAGLALAWTLALLRFVIGNVGEPATLLADGVGLIAAFAPTYVENFRRDARPGRRRVERRRINAQLRGAAREYSAG